MTEATSLVVSPEAVLGSIKRLDALRKMSDSAGISASRWLSFSPQGAVYSYKKDGSSEPQPLTGEPRMLANVHSIQHGYVCWKDGKVVDQIHWSPFLQAELPDIDTLPDHGPYSTDPMKREGWVVQLSLQLKSLDDDAEYIFKASSKSATQQLYRTFRDIATTQRQYDLKTDAPVVKLSKGSFIPKSSTQRVWFPKLIVEDSWVPLGDRRMSTPRIPTGEYQSDIDAREDTKQITQAPASTEHAVEKKTRLIK